ncbi:MAG: hypothetical protein J0H49_10580 [Acidobacteria bacterium]|nr:hypothetical protein [Acidobacteriota bacterium]
MIVAQLANGIIAQPEPGLEGYCPLCGREVVAKCGQVMAWHWAHVSGNSCDSWGGVETDWHRKWKLRFPLEWVEVPMSPHRADVAVPHGPVLEFQKSRLSVAGIHERERFYRNLVWVIDGRHIEENFDFVSIPGDRRSGLPAEFRWLTPSASWTYARMPVAVDFGRPSELFGMFVLRHWNPIEKWTRRQVESVFGERRIWRSTDLTVVTGQGWWWRADDFVHHMESWPDYVAERERILLGKATR